MNNKAVLLDTSFFLRLYDTASPLHANAREYFRYFLEQGVVMKISTIAVAEFCVKGELNDLPLRNLQIVPFNVDHATRAGVLMGIAYDKRKQAKEQQEDLSPRWVVTNDVKMFAQADTEAAISGFVSADSKAEKIHKMMNDERAVDFEFIDINTPCSQRYGYLKF